MPNFDYTTRDFSTIRSELIDRAGASLPEWTDRNSSDFMMALIDLWSYVGDVLHYYVDRSAGEAFLPTATQRESVLAFANLYDYVPNRIGSAVATVTVYNSTAASVVLPAYTTFTAISNGSTYGFYTLSDYTVMGGTSKTLTVRQGLNYFNQTVTSSTGTSVSNGQPTQRFSLYHKNIDALTLSVDVYEGTGGTAVEWRQVSYLSTAGAADSVYSVYVKADGTVQVQFGNGVNGRIPPTNVDIKVSYAVTHGEEGNVPANTIKTLNTSSFPGVSVSSSTAAVGGSDPESISSIKSSIPRAIRTGGRAVTLSDFSDRALTVPGVSKAVSAYATGTGTGGSVTVYAAPYQSGYSTTASTVTTITVDQTIRESVYNELIGSAMLGVSTIGIPSTISLTGVYIGLDLFVKENYVQQWVKTSVDTAITAMFEFDKVSFGQILTVGEFYRTILAIEGVDYAVITNFNTVGLNGTLASSGKITIDPYRLPKKGAVSITAYNGVTPPI